MNSEMQTLSISCIMGAIAYFNLDCNYSFNKTIEFMNELLKITNNNDNWVLKKIKKIIYEDLKDKSKNILTPNQINYYIFTAFNAYNHNLKDRTLLEIQSKLPKII